MPLFRSRSFVRSLACFSLGLSHLIVSVLPLKTYDVLFIHSFAADESGPSWVLVLSASLVVVLNFDF